MEDLMELRLSSAKKQVRDDFDTIQLAPQIEQLTGIKRMLNLDEQDQVKSKFCIIHN